MKVNRLNAAVSGEAGPRPGSAGAGRKGPGWGGCGREPGEAGRPSGEPLPALSLVGTPCTPGYTGTCSPAVD